MGTATDSLGVAASASQIVTVCHAMVEGNCVQEPHPTISPIPGVCEEDCGDPHLVEDAIADTGTAKPPCPTDGEEGPRVQALYVHRSENESRLSTLENSIRERMGAISKLLDASTPRFTQKIRYYCPGDGQAEVTDVAISSEKNPDGSYKEDMCGGIELAGYTASDRVYMVLPDMNTDTGPGAKSYVCTNSNIVSNNDAGPAYAVIEFKCWVAPLASRCDNGQKPAWVLLHEFMHTLGAVSHEAPGGDPRPHPNGDSCKCHSIDRRDVMSNFHNHPDAFGNPPGRCLDKEIAGWWVDCKKNTYYDPTPEQTEWLFTTGWNTARSHYLTNNRLVKGEGTVAVTATLDFFVHPHPPISPE